MSQVTKQPRKNSREFQIVRNSTSQSYCSVSRRDLNVRNCRDTSLKAFQNHL